MGEGRLYTIIEIYAQLTQNVKSKNPFPDDTNTIANAKTLSFMGADGNALQISDAAAPIVMHMPGMCGTCPVGVTRAPDRCDTCPVGVTRAR